MLRILGSVVPCVIGLVQAVVFVCQRVLVLLSNKARVLSAVGGHFNVCG